MCQAGQPLSPFVSVLLTTGEMKVVLFVEGQLTTVTHLEEVLQQNMQELNDRLDEWDEKNCQRTGVICMFHGAVRMYNSVGKSRDKYCTGYTDEGQDKAGLTNYI